jgi:hypothetical protein
MCGAYAISFSSRVADHGPQVLAQVDVLVPFAAQTR